jgi:hypothetical protein
MKKYTLLEALNMLKQDHDLVFKIVQEEALCNQMISSNVIGNVMVSCQGCQGRTNCPLQFKDMWTLEARPVSFMEAVKARKKGKKIYCKLEDSSHTFFPPINLEKDEMDEIEDADGFTLTTEMVLEGKWYIKEDEEETTSTDKTKFIEINYKDLRDNERHTKYFSTQEEYEKWHEENWNDVVING